MGEINMRIFVQPKKEIVAYCASCENELGKIEFTSYYDFDRNYHKLKDGIYKCSNCGEIFRLSSKKDKIPWERTKEGNYIAKAKNGDFMIWKYGYVYKWRYRKYGDKYPERIFTARTKDMAIKACKRHKEWKL